MDVLLSLASFTTLNPAGLLLMLMKGALLCAIGTAICFELSLMPAIVRHRIALGTVMGLAFLPLLSWSLSPWELAILPRDTTGYQGESFRYGEALVAVYCLVVLFMLLRLAFDIVAVWLISARAKPADMTLLRRLPLQHPEFQVTVKLSAEVNTPVICGCLRPVILLPADAMAWPSADMRMVLLHEYSHLERRDWLKHLVTRFITAFYWPIPGRGVLIRQLSLACEQACDDRVLASGARPCDYAAMLLRLARGAIRQAVPDMRLR